MPTSAKEVNSGSAIEETQAANKHIQMNRKVCLVGNPKNENHNKVLVFVSHISKNDFLS